MRMVNIEGKCWNCGSDIVEYCEIMENLKAFAGYTYHCDDCGKDGVQWYVHSFLKSEPLETAKGESLEDTFLATVPDDVRQKTIERLFNYLKQPQ